MGSTLLRPSALGLPTNKKIIVPAFMQSLATKYGDVNILRDPALRAQLGLLPGIGGGSSPLSGFHTEGDVITQSADGIPLNDLWDEFQRTLQLLNAQRQPLIDLLTYTVPRPVENVPQAGNANVFEEASEFGIPVGTRTGATYFQMGFSFKWYDTGLRYTWKYLAEADADQIRSDTEAILESDQRLVFLEVMKTLFRNTNRVTNINAKDYNVYAFYNNDGTVPPAYKTTTHLGTHTHYLTGDGSLDSVDVDTIQTHLNHHGYSNSNGHTLLLLVNQQEGDIIRNFRAPLNGGTSKFDFVPALGTPNFILPANLITNQGQDLNRPADSYRGIKVIGRYGDFLVLQDDYFPAGYLVGLATGGPENINNPIGIREHARADLRGLRLVKGRDPDYPLQESYYQRGFGTGIRHRGAGVIFRVASGAYATPTQYT